MTHRVQIAFPLGAWVRTVRPGRWAGMVGLVSGVIVRVDRTSYAVRWFDGPESYHRADELELFRPPADPTD